LIIFLNIVCFLVIVDTRGFYLVIYTNYIAIAHKCQILWVFVFL